jgi:hypothetical protein
MVVAYNDSLYGFQARVVCNDKLFGARRPAEVRSLLGNYLPEVSSSSLHLATQLTYRSTPVPPPVLLAFIHLLAISVTSGGSLCNILV